MRSLTLATPGVFAIAEVQVSNGREGGREEIEEEKKEKGRERGGRERGGEGANGKGRAREDR